LILIALAKLWALAIQNLVRLYNLEIYQICMADITTIRITKSTHKEILKIMGEIQTKTGEIPTLDDTLEMLSNYKKKSRK